MIEECNDVEGKRYALYVQRGGDLKKFDILLIFGIEKYDDAKKAFPRQAGGGDPPRGSRPPVRPAPSSRAQLVEIQRWVLFWQDSRKVSQDFADLYFQSGSSSRTGGTSTRASQHFR